MGCGFRHSNKTPFQRLKTTFIGPPGGFSASNLGESPMYSCSMIANHREHWMRGLIGKLVRRAVHTDAFEVLHRARIEAMEAQLGRCDGMVMQPNGRMAI